MTPKELLAKRLDMSASFSNFVEQNNIVKVYIHYNDIGAGTGLWKVTC